MGNDFMLPRRGSRGGEMGEFSPPPFSEPPSFFFFLSFKYWNNIWFLWFLWLRWRKFTPHFKILDPHLPPADIKSWRMEQRPFFMKIDAAKLRTSNNMLHVQSWQSHAHHQLWKWLTMYYTAIGWNPTLHIHIFPQYIVGCGLMNGWWVVKIIKNKTKQKKLTEQTDPSRKWGLLQSELERKTSFAVLVITETIFQQ